MKEKRDLQNEANKDMQDWQRYQAKNDKKTMIRILMQSVQQKCLPNSTTLMGRSHSKEPLPHKKDENQDNYPQGGNRSNYQGNNNQRGPASGAPIPQTAGKPMPTNEQVAQPQITFSKDPKSHEFYSKTLPIYAAITEANPKYKNAVGSAIFQFVTQIVGEDFGPKITGMLIDLPIKEIHMFCTNYDLFQLRAQQALNLLTQFKEPVVQVENNEEERKE